MTGIAGVALATVLFGSAHAFPAKDAGCKGNPALTGKCYWVHGNFGLSADSGLVVVQDSERWLTTWSAPNSEIDGPENLSRALSKAQHKAHSLEAFVHGAFEVCPIPSDDPSKSYKKYVCIQSAKNLTPAKWKRKVGASTSFSHENND
jgi:hypothetical protein